MSSDLLARLRLVRSPGIDPVTFRQGLYPRALAELDSALPLLIVKGDLRLLDRPMVAIVGLAAA